MNRLRNRAMAVISRTKGISHQTVSERRAAAMAKLTQALRDVYEGIFERVQDLPHALPRTLLQTMSRLERHMGVEVAHDAVCLLLCSAEGLTEAECQALLHIDQRQWRLIRRILRPLLRAVAVQGSPHARLSIDISTLFPKTVRLTGAVMAEEADELAEAVKAEDGGTEGAGDGRLAERRSSTASVASAASLGELEVEEDEEQTAAQKTLRQAVDNASRAAWELVRNKAKQQYNVILAIFFAGRAMGMTIGEAATRVEAGSAFMMVADKSAQAHADGGAYAPRPASAGSASTGLASGSDSDADGGLEPGAVAHHRRASVASRAGLSDGDEPDDEGFVSPALQAKAAARADGGTRAAGDAGAAPGEGGGGMMLGGLQAAAAKKQAEADRVKKKRRRVMPGMVDPAVEEERQRKQLIALGHWAKLRARLARGVSARQQQRSRYHRGSAVLSNYFRVASVGTGKPVAESVRLAAISTTGTMRVAEGRGRGARLVVARRTGRWVHAASECVAALRSLPSQLLSADRIKEAYNVLSDVHYAEAMATEGNECVTRLVADLASLSMKLQGSIESLQDIETAGPQAGGHGGGLLKAMLAASDLNMGGAFDALKAAALAQYGAKLQLKRERARQRLVTAMLDFVRADTTTLLKFPSITFQSMANLPVVSPVARLAKLAWEDGREDRPYLAWLNKPKHRSPCVMNLPAAAQPGGDTLPVTAVRVSSDARFIGATLTDGKVLVFSLKTGTLTTVLRSLDEQRYNTEYAAEAAKLSKIMAAHQEEDEARLRSNMPPKTWFAPKMPLRLRSMRVPPATALAWRPGSSRYLVVGTAEGSLFMWDRAVRGCKEVVRDEREETEVLESERKEARRIRAEFESEATKELRRLDRLDAEDQAPQDAEAQAAASEGSRKHGVEAGRPESPQGVGFGAPLPRSDSMRRTAAAGSSREPRDAEDEEEMRRTLRFQRRQEQRDVIDEQRKRVTGRAVLRRAHIGAVTALQWHDNGYQLLSGDAIGVVVLWQFGSKRVWDSLSPAQPTTLQRWVAHASPVRNVLFASEEWVPKLEVETVLDDDDDDLAGDAGLLSDPTVVPTRKTGSSGMRGAGLSMSASFASVPVRRRELGGHGDDGADPLDATGASRQSRRSGVKVDKDAVAETALKTFAGAATALQTAAAAGAVVKSHRRTMFHVRTPVHDAPAAPAAGDVGDVLMSASLSTVLPARLTASPASAGVQQLPVPTFKKQRSANPTVVAGIKPVASHAKKLAARVEERQRAMRERRERQAKLKREAVLKAQPKSYAARKWGRGVGARVSTKGRKNDPSNYAASLSGWSAANTEAGLGRASLRLSSLGSLDVDGGGGGAMQPQFSPMRMSTSASAPSLHRGSDAMSTPQRKYRHGGADPASPPMPIQSSSSLRSVLKSADRAGSDARPSTSGSVRFADSDVDGSVRDEAARMAATSPLRRSMDTPERSERSDDDPEHKHEPERKREAEHKREAALKGASDGLSARPSTGGSFRVQVDKVDKLDRRAAKHSEQLQELLDMTDTAVGAAGPALDGLVDDGLGPELLDADPSDSDSDHDGVPASRVGGALMIVTSGQATTFVWRMAKDLRSGKQVGQVAGRGMALRSGRKDLVVLAHRSNRTAKLVTSRGKRIPVLETAAGEMLDAQFNPRRDRVAVTFEDESLRVYRTDNGRCVGVMRGHLAPLRGVCWDPSGRCIVTGSDDGSVRVWQPSLLPEGVPPADPSGVCVAARFTETAEGKHGGQLAAVGADGRVKMFLTDTSEVWGTSNVIKDFTLEIRGVAFSHSGDRVVVVSSGGIRMWTSDPNNPRAFDDCKTDVAEEHTIALWCVDPTAHIVMFTDVDGVSGVQQRSTITNKLRARFAEDRALGMHKMQFSPDSRLLLTTDTAGTVCFYDVATASYVGGAAETNYPFTVKPPKKKMRKKKKEKKEVEFDDYYEDDLPAGFVKPQSEDEWETDTEDGNVVHGASAFEMNRVVGRASWEREPVVELNDVVATSPAARYYKHFLFCPDGARLLTISRDLFGSFNVWDLRQCFEERVRTANRHVDSNQTNIQRFTGHEAEVNDGAWSPDARWIATVSDDGTLRIWDAGSCEQLHRIVAHSGANATFCHWANVGTRLFTSGNDRTVRTWNPRTGEQLAVWQATAPIVTLTINNMGTTLMVGNSLGETKIVQFVQQPVEHGAGGAKLKTKQPGGAGEAEGGEGRPKTAQEEAADVDMGDVSGISVVVAEADRYARRKGEFAVFRATSGAGATTRGKHFAAANEEVPYVTPMRAYAVERSQWNTKLGFRCAVCGQPFQAYARLLKRCDTIAAKIKTFGPRDALYDDKNLLARCVSCKQTHRVTPFYMDNPWTLR